MKTKEQLDYAHKIINVFDKCKSNRLVKRNPNLIFKYDLDRKDTYFSVIVSITLHDKVIEQFYFLSDTSEPSLKKDEFWFTYYPEMYKEWGCGTSIPYRGKLKDLKTTINKVMLQIYYQQMDIVNLIFP